MDFSSDILIGSSERLQRMSKLIMPGDRLMCPVLSSCKCEVLDFPSTMQQNFLFVSEGRLSTKCLKCRNLGEKYWTVTERYILLSFRGGKTDKIWLSETFHVINNQANKKALEKRKWQMAIIIYSWQTSPLRSSNELLRGPPTRRMETANGWYRADTLALTTFLACGAAEVSQGNRRMEEDDYGG